MKIIKQEIQFEESLKQRLEFICEFSKVNPTIEEAEGLFKLHNADIISRSKKKYWV